MLEIVIDRTQAEIDAGLRRKALGRNSECVQGRKDKRLGFGVKRQDSPLLNKSTRQWLDKDPLRQRQFVRLTAALIASLIPRRQRHGYIRARPRVLRDVMGGLRRTGFGTRLRQRKCVVGRRKQRSRWLIGRLLVLERERGLRFYNAVVVIHPVIKAQRAPGLALRILDQFDVWRAVWNCGEIPDQVASQHTMHCRRTIAFDQQPPLLGPRRKRRTCFGRRGLDRAMVDDIEMYLAGGTDYQLTSYRYRNRRRRRRGFAWAQAQQHHRRPAGVNRRRNPGVDTEIRGRNNATPIESGCDALCPLTAGGKETCNHKNYYESAKRHRIAHRQARGRPAS